ncbi:MAG TPA: MFS transporter, partial [Gallionella sp.]|nr:MFS transporter [Gallionella sp.]
TTTFIALVSGRMIPAMAIISSAAQPKLRGTFMSLNASMQQLASGIASVIAGFIISQNSAQQIVGYGAVGYVAMAANMLAILYASRIVLRDASSASSALDVVPK